MDLKRLVSECIQDKTTDLLLDDLGLVEVPDLHELYWVEKLDLSKNHIIKVTRNLFPPNLKILILNQNNIKYLDHKDIPESVEVLKLLANQIGHFDGSDFKALLKLNISVNCLERFYFPPNIIRLDISTNTLETIGHFPETLLKIKCNDNMFTSFPYINNNLVYADISSNRFSEMPPFPESIEYIIATENYISDLWYIPEKVKVFNLGNNRLRNLHEYTIEFPKTLIMLNLADNMLSEIPSLPIGVQDVYLSGNRLEALPEIPMTVKILDISDNCLSSVPDELKKRGIKLKYDNNLIQEDSDELDLYRSTSPDDTLFGTMFDVHPKKKPDILDYFKKDTPTVTYYNGYNPNHTYNFKSTTVNTPSYYTPKYIYIKHKKSVVV